MFYKNFFIISLIILGLFTLINIPPYILLKQDEKKTSQNDVPMIDIKSEEGRKLLAKVYPGKPIEELRRLADGPAQRLHTVLHFTAGGNSLFKVGEEGIRYQEGWTDEQVRRWMAEPGRHTYVMGGSTVFGMGVYSNDTLSSVMGRERGGDGRFFNFGVPSYSSLRETDKLVYLLKKGFRPKAVVFIDGLNDIHLFGSSRFKPMDKPNPLGFFNSRGDVPLIFGRTDSKKRAILYLIPLTNYLMKRRLEPGAPPPGYQLADANKDPVDLHDILYFYQNWISIQSKRVASLEQEWLTYYKGNIEFIETLGRSFNFTPIFVLQPVGFLERGNVFVGDTSKSDTASIYRRIYGTAVKRIADGRLRMVDCSRAIDGEAVPLAYVDASHYSAQGSALLTNCIFGSSAWKEANR